MKASINKELCVGCGACTAICPAVFDMGDDGVAKVLVDPVPEGDQDCAIEAADSCPVGAIVVE